MAVFTAPPGWMVAILEDMRDYQGISPVAESEESSPPWTRINMPAFPWPIVATTSASPSAGPSLPVTGTNTTLLALAGVAAVAVGTGLVLVARRRRIQLRS
jgi:LPXTG-motif cell wall-anchored protein